MTAILYVGLRNTYELTHTVDIILESGLEAYVDLQDLDTDMPKHYAQGLTA